MKHTFYKKLVLVFAVTFLVGLCFANPQVSNLSVNDKIYDAIAENRISDLNVLVKESSDLNIPTTNGSSVFDAVMIFENCECAEILFQNKIDVYKKNKDGQNIHDQVVKSRNKKMIALLQKYYK